MSYNAIVFLGPRPLKNAFAFVDLLDPSIINMLLKQKMDSKSYQTFGKLKIIIKLFYMKKKLLTDIIK